MGRVTFQDPAVIEEVNKDYVGTWVNSQPSFQGSELKVRGEDLAPAFAKWWPSGHATTNVKCVVSTPRGEIIHVIPGFVRAPELVRELRFAADVGRAMDRSGDARRAAFVQAHKARIALLERLYGKADPAADLDTDTLKPEEIKADHFAQLTIRIERLLIAEPTRDRADENTSCGTGIETRIVPTIANLPPPQQSQQLSQEAGDMRAMAADIENQLKGPPPSGDALRLGGGARMTPEQWRAMKEDQLAWYKKQASELDAAAKKALSKEQKDAAIAKSFAPKAAPTSASAASTSGGAKPNAAGVNVASGAARPNARAASLSPASAARAGTCSVLTAGDIALAKQALENDQAVDRAIAAHAARARDREGWTKACSDVKAIGTPAFALLLDRLALGEKATAAYDVLRRITGEVIPDDEGAWTVYVCSRE